MEVVEVMTYLEKMGTEQIRQIFLNHGGPENMFGVKIGDLKPIQKKVKVNHELAQQLFDTGNSDAQYLAGLIADPKKFTKKEFEHWADNASWHMITVYVLAWNLAESSLCEEICREWIDSKIENRQECAWAAMGAYLGIVNNSDIHLDFQKVLLKRVEKEIHHAPNQVKYWMNSYVIALGAAFPEMTEICKQVGDRIGKVDVYMGKTSCKVPGIRPYLENIESKNRIGKKKKTAKC